MENDGMRTAEEEFSGGAEFQSDVSDTFKDQRISNSVARRFIADEGSIIAGEDATMSPYDNSDPALRDFTTDFSQIEGNAFGLDNAHQSSTAGKTENMMMHETQQQQLPCCQICGKNSQQDPRAMVFFSPSSSGAPSICLHVFCGKTASILPKIVLPHFEIMLKAGLKNKHGIGPDVNFALARTRSALAQGGEADKDPKRLDKEYFLVKEFETHLNSIRSCQHHRKTPNTIMPITFSSQMQVPMQVPMQAPMQALNPPSMQPAIPVHLFTDVSNRKPGSRKKNVSKPHKRSRMLHNTQNYSQRRNYEQSDWIRVGQEQLENANPPAGFHQGRVRCPCGGIYNSNKSISWKSHVKTKRHMQWSSHLQPSNIPMSNIYSQGPCTRVFDQSRSGEVERRAMGNNMNNEEVDEEKLPSQQDDI